LTLARFLASLMTLVSTKYMIFSGSVLDALEVLVLPHMRHGGEDFRKAFLPGCQDQYLFKDGTVFGLSTPPMSCGSLPECLNNTLIEIPDE
jgi:hypothetical protein